MAERVFIFVQHGGYPAAYQATSLGVTAAAMGDQVYFVMAFNALSRYVEGTFGRPDDEPESAESSRASGLGVPEPYKMLQEARGLGAKIMACDTVVRICGLTPSAVSEKLDEVLGLPSIWRLARGGRVLTF